MFMSGHIPEPTVYITQSTAGKTWSLSTKSKIWNIEFSVCTWFFTNGAHSFQMIWVLAAETMQWYWPVMLTYYRSYDYTNSFWSRMNSIFSKKNIQVYTSKTFLRRIYNVNNYQPTVHKSNSLTQPFNTLSCIHIKWHATTNDIPSTISKIK